MHPFNALFTIAGMLLLLGAPATAQTPSYVTDIPDSATIIRARNPVTNAVHELYAESHALIIGQSNYQTWDKLPAVALEVLELTEVLERHRFKVEVYTDLTADQFVGALASFMRRRATVTNARIFVYIAGHGWAPSRSPPFGFFLPIDAPDSSKGAKAVEEMAIPMELFAAWAKLPHPRHMFFAFDACFSGSFFGPLNPGNTGPDPEIEPSKGAKAFPLPAAPAVVNRPPEASDAVFARPARWPARQFISAGLENEVAPKKSVFTRLLIEILSGKRAQEAAMNFDHWTTASELGSWLQQHTPRFYEDGMRKTHPLFGPLLDRAYANGDMAFHRLDLIDQGSSLLEPLDPDPWLSRKRLPKTIAPRVALETASSKQAEVATQLTSAVSRSAQLQAEQRKLSSQIAEELLQIDDDLRKVAQAQAQELEAARKSVQDLQGQLSQANTNVAIAKAAVEREEVTKAFATPTTLSVQQEASLQSIVDALSCSETPCRRKARLELSKFMTGLPQAQAEMTSARLLRDLYRKSYRYQLGMAVSIVEQPGQYRTADAAETRRELTRALQTSKDPTLKQNLQRALARLG